MLQEQYWSAYTKSSPIHPSWTLIEPTAINDTQPRSVIYVNKYLLPASQISPLKLPFSDVSAITITTMTNTKPHLIINVYNPCDKSIIPELHKNLRNTINTQDYDLIIIGGDFNTHHPLWNPKEYTRHDEDADTLVNMMMELELTQLLPPGTITYTNADTVIDLVWGNREASNCMIKCQIAEEHDHGADHVPIETTIDLQVIEIQPTLSYNYAKTNWEELKSKLEQILPDPIPTSTTTPAEIDTFAEEIVKAIYQAVDETTPRKKRSQHSKRWWKRNLTQMRGEANHLRNKYRRKKTKTTKEAWRNKANEYKCEIKKAKRDTWKKFVNDANPETIWQINNYITNTPISTFVPTLDTNATTYKQKINALRKVFFPKPPPADLSDIPPATYPQEASYDTTISVGQIRKAINKLAPGKAPGPDEISNKVLKETLPIIEQHLQILMQASVNTGHFPKPFKHTTTIVLRKPGKPDYTVSKAYRPIALENTLGKVLESVMADTMSYITETHELLPAQHFGGRPGRSTEDAMMILSESIHKAWKNNKVFSAVFMDVAGAFNNVHHERLIHNLKTRRMPLSIAKWIGSFLQGRSTQILFNDAKSDTITTPAGIPQGSPLSPLLYMYYNADLLDIPQQHETSLGFIDDIMYGVEGFTDEANARRLEQLVYEAEKWRIKHGAQFEPSKYVLVHFTRNYRRSTDAAINIEGATIKPANQVKYLGVIFDKKL